MRIILASVPLLLWSCHNTCQDLCKEMAAYAESDKCQYTLSDDELKVCIRDHSRDKLADGDLGVCEDFADTVADEWTCDDLAPYFGQGDESGDTR